MEVKDLFSRRNDHDTPATLWDSDLPPGFVDGLDGVLEDFTSNDPIGPSKGPWHRDLCLGMGWRQLLGQHEIVAQLRKERWYAVLQCIELVAEYYRKTTPSMRTGEIFESRINYLCELKSVNWRLDHRGRFVKRIENVTAIEGAIAKLPSRFVAASECMKKAWDFFNLRPIADTANCVKEAISAVESAAKVGTGDEKAKFSDAVEKLNVHPALRIGMLKLYGYASDEPGVRHGSAEAPSVPMQEAELVLTICAGLVVFLSQMKPATK